MMSTVLLIAILTVVFTFILWLLGPNKHKKATDEIPGPPHLPLIGNAHLMSSDAAGNHFINIDVLIPFCSNYEDMHYVRGQSAQVPCKTGEIYHSVVVSVCCIISHKIWGYSAYTVNLKIIATANYGDSLSSLTTIKALRSIMIIAKLLSVAVHRG